MNLLKLAWKSILRKPINHSIYAISLLITAFISNTYWSIQTNKSVNEVIQSKESFAAALTIGGIIVFIFLIILVLYTNRFYITVRQNELGTYLLFGESNFSLLKLLFTEQLLFVFTAGVVGNLLGTLFSKLFGTILVRMMGYENQVAINVSWEPVLVSFALLIIAAVFVTLFNIRRFSKISLVSLFTGNSDVPKIRKGNAFLAFLGIFLIIGSLLYSTQTSLDSTILILFVSFTLGVILFINQTLTWYINYKTRHRRYFIKTDMISTASLRSKLPRNTFQLTMITLLSSVTLFFVTFSLLNLETQKVVPRTHLPDDFLYSYVDQVTENKIHQTFEGEIKSHKQFEAIAITAKSPIKSAFTNSLQFGNDGYIMSLSAYNKLRQFRGEKKLATSLQDNEALSFSRGSDTVDLDVQFQFQIGTTPKTLHVIKRLDATMIGWRSDIVQIDGEKPPTFVVSDVYYSNAKSYGNIQKFSTFLLKEPTKQLAHVKTAVSHLPENTYYSAYVIPYTINVESGALLLFVSTFFAIISFMALGATIYFKQLQEAYADKPRFKLLKELGADEKILHKNIRKQLAILFIAPSLLGTAEAFALTVPIINEVDSINAFSFVSSLIGVFLLIYLLFYLSSVAIYRRITS